MYINGFLNSSGGSIHFGIREAKDQNNPFTVEHVEYTFQLREEIIRMIEEKVLHFTPPVPAGLYEVVFVDALCSSKSCSHDKSDAMRCYVVEIHVRPPLEASSQHGKLYLMHRSPFCFIHEYRRHRNGEFLAYERRDDSVIGISEEMARARLGDRGVEILPTRFLNAAPLIPREWLIARLARFVHMNTPEGVVKKHPSPPSQGEGSKKDKDKVAVVVHGDVGSGKSAFIEKCIAMWENQKALKTGQSSLSLALSNSGSASTESALEFKQPPSLPTIVGSAISRTSTSLSSASSTCGSTSSTSLMSTLPIPIRSPSIPIPTTSYSVSPFSPRSSFGTTPPATLAPALSVLTALTGKSSPIAPAKSTPPPKRKSSGSNSGGASVAAALNFNMDVVSSPSPSLQFDILAYHFCHANIAQSVSPVHFVRSVAALIARPNSPVYKEYVQAVYQLQLEDLLSFRKCQISPLDSFRKAVLNPLCAITPRQPCVLIVDAIDEADWCFQQHQQPHANTSHITISQLLHMSLPSFPPWLKLIVTARVDAPSLGWNRYLHLCENIQLGGREAEQDIYHYVTMHVRSKLLPSLVPDSALSPPDQAITSQASEIVSTVCECAHGNFLYAQLVLDTITSATETKNLKISSLSSLYERIFDREFDEKKSLNWKDIRLVFEALLASQYQPYLRHGRGAIRVWTTKLVQLMASNALSKESLAVFSLLHNQMVERTSPNASPKSSTVCEDESTPTLVFHQSFLQWLTDKDQNQRYFCDRIRGHAVLAAAGLRKIWQEAGFSPHSEPLPQLQSWLSLVNDLPVSNALSIQPYTSSACIPLCALLLDAVWNLELSGVGHASQRRHLLEQYTSHSILGEGSLSSSDILDAVDPLGQTAVYLACSSPCVDDELIRKTNLQVIDLLLSAGASVNRSVDKAKGMSALHMAICVNPDPSLIKCLLRHSCMGVTLTSHKGRTALHYAAQAARSGDESITKLLLPHADADARANDGQTALMMAAAGGFLPVVKALIEVGGASIDVLTPDGRSALYFAAMNGHVPIVEYLMSHDDGSLTCYIPPDGKTVLWVATENNHKDVVNALLSGPQGKPIPIPGMLNLINLATTKFFSAYASESAQTPLWLAVNRGDADMVRLLLEKGKANPDLAENSNLRTPLMDASWNGREDIVSLLLEHGADPCLTEKDGGTALMDASFQGHLKVAELLLSGQGLAVVNQADVRGFTALHYAAGRAHFDVVKLLLSKKETNTLVRFLPKKPSTPSSPLKTSQQLTGLTPHEMVTYVLEKLNHIANGVSLEQIHDPFGLFEALRIRLVSQKSEVRRAHEMGCYLKILECLLKAQEEQKQHKDEAKVTSVKPAFCAPLAQRFSGEICTGDTTSLSLSMPAGSLTMACSKLASSDGHAIPQDLSTTKRTWRTQVGNLEKCSKCSQNKKWITSLSQVIYNKYSLSSSKPTIRELENLITTYYKEER